MKILSDVLVKAGLVVEGTFSANAVTNTIYAGTGTRLRTEANNLVFERVSSSGAMKMIFAQGTLSATAKAYIGYNNATLNLILSNEYATSGLELRTNDIIRQQIFSTGNIVIGQSAPVDAGFKVDITGTLRATGIFTGSDIRTGSHAFRDQMYITATTDGWTRQSAYNAASAFTMGFVGDLRFAPSTSVKAVFSFNGTYSNNGTIYSGDSSLMKIFTGDAFGNTISATNINGYGVNLMPILNYTTGTSNFTGFYYNPTIVASTGLTHYAMNLVSGLVRFGDLAGTGDRMVVANSSGVLTTQAIVASGLPTGGTAGQILSKIDGTNYNTQWIDNYANQVKHDVKLAEAMSIGAPVYVSTATGTNMIVSKASNANESTSSKVIGLIATGGVTNDIVKVITEGLIAGLDTSAATIGDPIWLGATGNLIFGITNKPYAPAHLVYIGVVTRVHAVNGEAFVNIQNGFEMRELHDYDATGVANNYVISYESSTGLYKPKSIATLLGYTPVTSARTITINGTSYDLSADRSWTVSANQNARTEYEFTTDGITATYTATYSLGQVDVFYNGSKLASTEFTATNGTSVTLSFTPPSGQFVEVVAWETGGGVSAGRTLTINGTAYDLSANRSWTIPTHDAVTLGIANGLALTGQQLSLELADSFTTGALSSTDWNTFNNKQNTLTNPVTGTGTSGYVAFWNGANSVTGVSNLFWDNSNIRLGIGLNNPQRKLEIYSATADSHLRLSGPAPSVSLGEAITGAVYQAKFGLATANGQYASGALAGDFVVISQTGAIIFNTNSANSLKLTSSGSTFYGALTGTSATFTNPVTIGNYDGQALKLQTATPTGSSYIRFYNSTGGAEGYFGLFNSSGTNYMLFDAGSRELSFYSSTKYTFTGGSLGLGTSNPNAKLEVLDTATSSGEVARFQRNIDAINEYAYIRVGNSSYPAYFGSMLGTYDVAYMSMTQDASQGKGIYVRTVDGFVGLGTVSPTHLLSLYGATQADIKFQNAGATRAYIWSNSAELAFNSLTSNPIKFFIDDVERVRFLANGNVRYYITPAFDTNIEWYNPTQATVQARIWGDGTPRLNAQAGGSGGVYLSSGATSWTGNSDERLKKINSIIPNALTAINSLRAVNFSWHSDQYNKENLGLIAQDVIKVLPQIVDTGNDGIMGVRYSELTPVLVKAIQEEDKKVTILEQKVAQQQVEIESLKARLN